MARYRRTTASSDRRRGRRTHDKRLSLRAHSVDRLSRGDVCENRVAAENCAEASRVCRSESHPVAKVSLRWKTSIFGNRCDPLRLEPLYCKERKSQRIVFT